MKILLLTVCLWIAAFSGWSLRRIFRSAREQDAPGAESAFLCLLTGLGIFSLLWFLLAAAGMLRGAAMLASLGVLAVIAALLRSGLPGRREAAFLFGIPLMAALISSALYRFTPPYEAFIVGDDASVYLAAAEQIADSGGSGYRDALVKEMSIPEREAFFRNRFYEDWTGPYVRFPGGVRLIDPGTGSVRFAFYPLTPVWLAVAIRILGPAHYLIWISLTASLVLLTLFFLGRRMGGFAAGIALPVLLFVFYPHQYFSRFPLSEPLAQLFFLAGFLSFLRILDDRSDAPPAVQGLRLTGLLWGAAFLCRVDCIYVTALFLVAIYTVAPAFACRWRYWIPLFRVLAFFFLLALANQFAAGEYVSLFTNRLNLRSGAITDLGLEVVTSGSGFVQNHPWTAVAVLVALAFALLFAPLPLLARPSHPRSWPRALAGIVLVALALTPIVGFSPKLSWLVQRAQWFIPYAPPWLYVLLGAGVLLTGSDRFRKPATQAGLLLLALSCCVYLFRPLIFPEQPWAMRRFLPVLAPVFCLLSVSGWSHAIQWLPLRNTIRSAILLAGAAGAVLCLLPKSGYLFSAHLYQGVLEQTDDLARRIPRGSLVLIPDAMAGMHLQLPLQYRHGIDTLLLPLDYRSGRRLSETVRSFIRGQMRWRPVVVLSSDGTRLIHPLWTFFTPRELDHAQLSVLLVPRVSQFEFPGSTLDLNARASIYMLRPQGFVRTPRDVLAFDDPVITFLNFHEKESGFRWTRDHSIVTDFSFDTRGQEIQVLVDVGPLPPQFNSQNPDITVTVNYKIPARFVKCVDHTLHFLVNGGTVSEIRSLSIRTQTFRENAGPAARELGLSLVKVRLHSGVQEP